MGREHRHTTTGPTLGETRRGMILPLLGIGWGWAGFMLVLPVLPYSLVLVGILGSGFVAAAYLAPLYVIRNGAGDPAAALMVVLVFCSHVVWVAVFSGVLHVSGFTYRGSDESVLLLLTGVGSAIALGIASRSAIMLLAVAVVGLTAAAMPALVPDPSGHWGFSAGIAVLHAGMVSVVVIDTWRRPAPPAWAGTETCFVCGYSLAGLPAGAVCPECGNRPPGWRALPGRLQDGLSGNDPPPSPDG